MKAVLLGAYAAFAYQAQPVRTITELEMHAVADAVRDNLRDSESARFRWLPEVASSGMYCGLVNAKNGYGGYSGYMVFSASIAHYGKSISVSRIHIGSDDAESEELLKECQQWGIDSQSQ